MAEAGYLSPKAVFIDGSHIKANANTKKQVKAAIPVASKHYAQELMEEVNDLAKFHMMSNGGCTIATIGSEGGFYTIKLAMVFLSLERTNHFFNEIIDIEELHIYRWVVDGDW